jgi:acyl-CoA synthetase (AMP-forming)/AMP-acid ligase II
MNLACWLQRVALRAPDAPALFLGVELVATYGAWAGTAARIAAFLQAKHGVNPGDRVGLFMHNHPRYLEWLLGAWWAGVAVVPINAKLHAAEAEWILENSGAKLVVSADDNLQALSARAAGRSNCAILSSDAADAAADVDWRAHPPVLREMDDLAWLFYTSGTTGRPKGVMLSNANLVAASASYPLDVDPVDAADASLYAAPVSHGAGLYSLVHLRQGARHVFPPSGGFDPAEIFAIARELRNVSFFAAPTMVRRLTEHARAGSENGDGIKTIVYGGGPMYQADIVEALATFGQRFVQIYGQGESPMTITALSRAAHADVAHQFYSRRLASVGTAQSVVSVRVTGPDGEVLPPHQHGEIEVKGLTVMQGYWQNPDATRSTLKDGWLRTGDVGMLDEDGFLTLTDRSKDVIISGGTNIYPREVEEVLLSHPAVREVSVVGVKDPEWGEIVVAVVVADADVDDSALDAFCVERIARFKRPKRYVRVEALPKNNYGKILKTELRSMLANEKA